MEFETFVRKPFVVKAVEITEDNIEELAKFIGTLKHDEEGNPFIEVNRHKVPNIPTVHPGYWMTRMGKNTRCYAKRIFEREFVASNPQVAFLVDKINENALEVVDG